MSLFPALELTVSKLEGITISTERQRLIKPLVAYIAGKLNDGDQVNLNFICTHNSRRSQLAQVWAYLAAYRNKLNVNAFSGGVEVTAFNRNAINVLEKAGFKIEFKDRNEPNSIGYVRIHEATSALATFSKLYNHKINPAKNFAAIMTCSDADENCPFIPGAEIRIPLLYEDPKLFDGTPQQDKMYLERSNQIGTELLWAFSQVRQNLDL